MYVAIFMHGITANKICIELNDKKDSTIKMAHKQVALNWKRKVSEVLYLDSYETIKLCELKEKG